MTARPASLSRARSPPTAAGAHSTPTSAQPPPPPDAGPSRRSEEHTSELQSLMRISYAVFCLKKKKNKIKEHTPTIYQSEMTHHYITINGVQNQDNQPNTQHEQ